VIILEAEDAKFERRSRIYSRTDEEKLAAGEEE